MLQTRRSQGSKSEKTETALCDYLQFGDCLVIRTVMYATLNNTRLILPITP